MANDNTEFDVIIPEIWSSDMLEALYEEAGAVNRVSNVSGEVAALGDKLNLPNDVAFSVNDVTASSGAVTDQDVTILSAQLTIDKWKEVTFQVVDKAAKQAQKIWMPAWRNSSFSALAQQIESDVLALYSDVTTYTGGDSTSQANEDLLTAAFGQLLGNKLGKKLENPNESSWIFHTSQWESLRKAKVYGDANITGESVGGGLKKKIPDIYGIPVYFNTQVGSTGGARQNLLLTRDAFACGIQSNPEFKELSSTGLARRYCANVLYGVKTRKEDRAALIKTRA